MLNATIPIYIVRYGDEGADHKREFEARPLFFDLEGSAARLEDQTIEYLAGAMRRHLSDLAVSIDQQELVDATFCPPCYLKRTQLFLRLRKHTFDGVFDLVVFESLERRLAFVPGHPELCFDWPRDTTLVVAATDFLSAFFKSVERDGGRPDIEAYAAPPFSRIDHLEIRITRKQKLPDNDPRRFFMMGDGEEMDGAHELERVGRCLGRLVGSRRGQILLRDPEIRMVGDHLDGRFQVPAMKSRDNRSTSDQRSNVPPPLVLTGPSKVGKSAVIEEYVRLRETTTRGQVWLISPQRVISGMSYVGQWEDRFLAILHHATKQGHILYLDDLPGLFQAGKTSNSDLTLGLVLKAHLEENPVRIIAEATASEWARVREIDRGFADLFRVQPITEPDEDSTLRILVRTMQRLEPLHRCDFGPDVLPLVISLCRRYLRGTAFPGKAAELLGHLAANHPDQPIGRDDLYRHFHSKTGIGLDFLNRSRALDPDEAEAFFRERIVGQDAAVQAMLETVLLAKAGLNDPGRPVGSLLFLGPTGVGKTECAKALAEFLFGSSDRMLRFDMNEFVGPDAAGRLIGTAARPGGLLTSAVRRTPFSVVLLDEIEKAHPDVFDILLQVLGDARLNDASGRTADFGNSIVILTSNLGSDASGLTLGFGGEPGTTSANYRRAAEGFFRPELFNRLDRIVAFHTLERAHIESLVSHLVGRVLRRPGIRSRRASVRIDQEVYQFLAGEGFDPTYGARALRRTIEENFSAPLAGLLAQLPPGAAGTVRVSLAEGQIVIATENLAPTVVAAVPPPTMEEADVVNRVDELNEVILDVEYDMEGWETSSANDGGVSPSLAYHYLLREEVHALGVLRERLFDYGEAMRLARQRGDDIRRAHPRNAPQAPTFVSPDQLDGLTERILDAPDPARLLAEISSDADQVDRLNQIGWDCHCKSSQIRFLTDESFAEARELRFVMRGTLADALTADTPAPAHIEALRPALLQQLFQITDAKGAPILESDFRDRRKEPITLQIETHAADAMPSLLAGSHLFIASDASAWHARLELEDSAPNPDTPVVTITAGSTHLDLRTGQIGSRPPELWHSLAPTVFS